MGCIDVTSDRGSAKADLHAVALLFMASSSNHEPAQDLHIGMPSNHSYCDESGRDIEFAMLVEGSAP